MFLENIVIFLGVVALAGGFFITKDECPPNEEYLLCGSACPFNCSDPVGPVTCAEECVEGCFCKAGFLRDDSGSCVRADLCRGGTPQICGENAELLPCGMACPLTFKQPVTLMCGPAGGMACFCKSGYVRDTENHKCVTLDKCSFELCLNNNEVYDICNAGCVPSCSDPEPICAQICTGGCVCAPGFLRDDNGECISADKCSTNSPEEQSR